MKKFVYNLEMRNLKKSIKVSLNSNIEFMGKRMNLDQLVIRELEAYEFIRICEDLNPLIFPEFEPHHEIDLAKPENSRYKNYPMVERTYLGVFIREQCIGYSYSWEDGPASLYMESSGVHPDFRRVGIYTKVLDYLCEKAASEGYKDIHSRHQISNNSIIIAKLKYGFQIFGLEIDERFGEMIRMKFAIL